MSLVSEKILVKIERDGRCLTFGEGVVLSRLEAQPVKLGPRDGFGERLPLERKITLEGYIIPTDEGQALSEIAMARHLLSKIASPVGQFSLHIGDRRADLENGELSFPRSEPFSGEMAERFVLKATVMGGYFLGEAVVCTPVWDSDGSVITLENGGEVPAPFTAEFSPTATVYGFSLRDSETGKHITCPMTFGTGDVIKISTDPENMYLLLIRGGVEMSLTGRGDSDSELFSLTPGEHTLTVTGGVPFTGNLTFAEKYVSY